MNTMKLDFLFVYGKLREHYTFEDTFDVLSLITIPVSTTGKLYDLDDEAILFEDESSTVYGNLLSSTNLKTLLRHTDAYMGYNENDTENSRYVRVVKKVTVETLGEEINVWCYIIPSSRRYNIEKKGILVENGDWLKYIKEKKLKKLDDKTNLDSKNIRDINAEK